MDNALFGAFIASVFWVALFYAYLLVAEEAS